MTDFFTLEDGPFGLRASISGPWSRDYVEACLSAKVSELELNQGKGWRGDNVDFLADLPHLKALEMLDLNIKDVSAVHYLRDLRRLGLTTYCSTELDFTAFPELESCGLEWRPKATSLFGCHTLKHLFVNRYKGESAAEFGRLSNLESLAVLNSPIQDLLGLEKLAKLTTLRLANLAKLQSLAGLRGLRKLEELNINTCKGISSIDEIRSLHQLRRLYLNNIGEVASLKPLEELQELNEVLFYESTDVVDGDLSVLLELGKLVLVSFRDRKHYTHKREIFRTKGNA